MKARRTLRIGLVVATVLFLAATVGCKRKPERPEERAVSWEDITVGYPDVAGQRQRLKKFADVISSKSPTGKPDEALRQMIEEVPLGYVARRLEGMAKEPSAASKPNIGVLVERVKEIRSAGDRDASRFIEKLKQEKNANALCVALCGFRTEAMRAKVGDALASLRDPAATRVVTIQLLSASGMHEGGTEGRILREQLRSSLAKALASCTGLDFSGYDASESATLEVVKRCQDWLEETVR